MRKRARRRHLALGTLVLASALLVGCGETAGSAVSPSPSESRPEAPTDLDAEGVAAWNLWQEQSLDSYTYDLTVSCYCPALMGVEVVVRDGEVVQLDGEPYDGETTVPGFDGRSPTLDHLFAVLAEDQQRADKVTVRYDAQTGVPVSIEVDHMANAIDDEISYDVENVLSLQPTG